MSEQEMKTQPSKKKKKEKVQRTKGQKIRRGIFIAVGVIAALVLILGIVAYAVLQHYINKMNYTSDDEINATTMAVAEMSSAEKENLESEIHSAIQSELQSSVYESVKESLEQETKENGETKDEAEISREAEEEASKAVEESVGDVAEEIASVVESQDEAVESIPVVEEPNVFNLLLIGSDARANQGGSGHGDTIMLASINYSTGNIYLSSIMRDTCMNIDGVGPTKVKNAYLYGGGPLMVKTLQDSLRLKIDAYAAVDFYGLVSIFDSIGGLQLTISDDEATVANRYIRQMCTGVGEDPEKHYFPGGGTFQCDGYQLVGYCRIRYVGRYDFERTERQRAVLTKLFTKLKGSGLGTVNTFLNAALPCVTHNMSNGTIMNLIMKAPTLLNYGLNTSIRVPFDGEYKFVPGEYMLFTDLPKVANTLRSIIYGK